MSRIAWCSPWPPEAGDAAERSAAVVPALRARGFEIDTIVNDEQARAYRANAAKYALAVYHLADSSRHGFIWPLVFSHPGLTVLHEGRLHRSRSRMLIDAKRAADYRAEFAWNHPHVAPAIAELAVAGHDGGYSSQWPMVRAVIAASRLTATHASGAIAELEAECPDRPIEYVPASQGSETPPAIEDERQAHAWICRLFGWPESTIVFSACGSTSTDARLPQVLRAFAGVHRLRPDARLLLVDAHDPEIAHFVTSRGLTDHVRHIESSDEVILGSDVVLVLRWPGGLDVPGYWLRALAARRATIGFDLAHLAHVPALDPRTWRRHAPSEETVEADSAAVTVAVDVLDEDHSLRIAMQRLASDVDLGTRLGRAARAYWEAEHSPSRMVDGYAAALSRALALPRPAVELPAHLRPVMS